MTRSVRHPLFRRRAAPVLALAVLLGLPAGFALAQSSPVTGSGTATAPVASPNGTATSAATATPDTPAAPAPVPALMPNPAPKPATMQPPVAPAGEAQAQSADAVQHDFSPWGMFRAADIVVKVVMGILAAASVVTWTIFIAKRVQLAGARFRAIRGVREVLRAGSLFDLDRAHHKGPLKAGPVASLVHAAAHERERSTNLPADGIKERAAIALGRIEARAARSMTRGTGLVASIGSTAPFVGLFGTVWGIMNSFVGISQAHTTNLAVVAPGIAEALLATAIGLVAAIPAVIIYNGLARAIAGYKAILSDASAEIMRHLSRDLDRQVQAAE